MYGQSYELKLPIIVGNSFTLASLLDFSLLMSDNNPHSFSLQIQINYGTNSTTQYPVALMSSEQITLESNIPFSTYPESQVVLQSILYSNSTFQDYCLQHGVLPTGSYSICYTLTLIQEPYTISQCLNIETQFSPEIILISPYDEDVVEISNPIFNWVYPQILSQTNYYQYIIVEVFTGQTAEEAFLSNQLLYSTQSVVPFIFYSVTAPSLENCHTYAWMVQLFDNEELVKESEIWTFTMACPDTDTMQAPTYFFPLTEGDDGSTYTTGRYINFKFDQYYEGITDFSIDIYDLHGNNIIPYGELVELRMNTPNYCYNGTNLFQIDFNILGFYDEGTFILRLRNQKQDYSLKFQHILE